MACTIACIGSGNMGFALMKNACGGVGGKGADSVKIFFTDADTKKAEEAAAAIGAKIFSSNIEAVEKSDYIFLAVKPQVLSNVLAEIAPAAKKRAVSGLPPVLVSMAAGWSIEKIQSAVGANLPVTRIMPNTPAIIGKGMIAASFSPEVTEKSAAELKNILSGAGNIDEIEERYLNAVTGLSGSGPAFVYLFIEALADGGVLAGLPRDKALRYASQTVLGAAAMVQETGKHPGELKDMVTSPGGTTIAGIKALEDCSFRGAVINAVDTAWRKARELG